MTIFLLQPIIVIGILASGVGGYHGSEIGTAAIVQPRAVTTAQASVELIAGAPTVPATGGEFWLGIRFQLRDKWHIYWRNPGDSGEPPSVRWHLPDGVRADDIEWPMPKRIPVGPLVSYGYEGDVVLPVRLRIPPEVARAH